MEPQLGEGEDFKQFLKCSNATRECDKPIGKLCHSGFAFVHGFHHAQLGQSLMGDFLINQRLRNDTGGRSASSDDRIGDNAHYADTRSTIDQFQIALRKRTAEIYCTPAICITAADVRTAEHADSFHATSRQRGLRHLTVWVLRSIPKINPMPKSADASKQQNIATANRKGRILLQKSGWDQDCPDSQHRNPSIIQMLGNI